MKSFRNWSTKECRQDSGTPRVIKRTASRRFYCLYLLFRFHPIRCDAHFNAAVQSLKMTPSATDFQRLPFAVILRTLTALCFKDKVELFLRIPRQIHCPIRVIRSNGRVNFETLRQFEEHLHVRVVVQRQRERLLYRGAVVYGSLSRRCGQDWPEARRRQKSPARNTPDRPA